MILDPIKKYKPTFYCYAIIIYSAMNSLWKVAHFSVKRFAISLTISDQTPKTLGLTAQPRSLKIPGEIPNHF